MSQPEQTVIKTAAGNVFKTQKAAAYAMGQRDLDPRSHEIVAEGDGFVIRSKAVPHKAQVQIGSDLQARPVQQDSLENRYFRVIFGAKRDKHETNDVIWQLNGRAMVAQRETELIITGPDLAVIRNAKIPHFEQLPGKPRKVDSHIDVYPVSILSEATKEEYEEFLKQPTV
jgi:hypothetical protein